MTDGWFLLLLVIVAAWVWLDASRAREFAILHGHALCRDAGVQLLDQTVSLERLRLGLRDGLPTFLRRYRFEVSLDGSDRHRGHLDLAGHRFEGGSLPVRNDGATPLLVDAPVQACCHASHPEA